jgi:hypothetical protein
MGTEVVLVEELSLSLVVDTVVVAAAAAAVLFLISICPGGGVKIGFDPRWTKVAITMIHIHTWNLFILLKNVIPDPSTPCRLPVLPPTPAIGE